MSIESYFGHKLPRRYLDFLLTHCVELDGDLYLQEDVIERNECYETKKYAPGYINIGDNGAGEAFIIKLVDDDPEVSIVGHCSMDPDLKDFVYKNFSSWRLSGFSYENELSHNV